MSLRYKLVFYVPEADCEKVKQAIFASGAGRLGNYQQCCWQTTGQGQFRPMSGSDPHLGSVDHLERVCEVKVETICMQKDLKAVVAALRVAHPYEEPAYDIWPLIEV